MGGMTPYPDGIDEMAVGPHAVSLDEEMESERGIIRRYPAARRGISVLCALTFVYNYLVLDYFLFPCIRNGMDEPGGILGSDLGQGRGFGMRSEASFRVFSIHAGERWCISRRLGWGLCVWYRERGRYLLYL